MAILTGALTVRRYHVQGAPPDGFRELFIEALNRNSFREPLSPVHKEEIAGWTQLHNLLDTSFDDVNRWLYNQYALFALRVEKKVLPARLFKAHLDKRMQAWCEQTGRERCPTKVKEELKVALEQELLQRTLPRVQTYEVVWNVAEGWVLFHNQSGKVNDRFRQMFQRTFGLDIVPVTPVDLLADKPDLAAQIVAVGTSQLRDGGFASGGRE